MRTVLINSPVTLADLYDILFGFYSFKLVLKIRQFKSSNFYLFQNSLCYFTFICRVLKSNYQLPQCSLLVF